MEPSPPLVALYPLEPCAPNSLIQYISFSDNKFSSSTYSNSSIIKFSIPYLFIASYRGRFSPFLFLLSLQCSLNLSFIDYVVFPTYLLLLIILVIQ